jgi:hypothetical protein
MPDRDESEEPAAESTKETKAGNQTPAETPAATPAAGKAASKAAPKGAGAAPKGAAKAAPKAASADDETDDEAAGGALLSSSGIASTVLGVVAVVALVLGVLIWTDHRDDSAERVYLNRVMQAAADWTDVLINMNSGNLDASLQRLHDGTVGQLNTDFDAAVQPYRQVVEKLQTHTTGQIEAVAIDTVHRDLDTQPGSPRAVVTTKLPAFATRTDSVMLVATSVSENAGAKPQMVHWSLRLDVSNVDNKLMISKLESIR